MAFSRGLPFGMKAVAVGVQGAWASFHRLSWSFASNPAAAAGRSAGRGRLPQPAAAGPCSRRSPAVPLRGLCRLFGGVFPGGGGPGGRPGRRGLGPLGGPWTLAAWSLFTVGITLGSFWAYYELGWGGWWFWDPVENASLMPWLAGRRSALRCGHREARRSGVLDGVSGDLHVHALHARRVSGPFGCVDLGSRLCARPPPRGLAARHSRPGGGVRLVLFAWRAPRLKDQAVFAPISRESALVVNNIRSGVGDNRGPGRDALAPAAGSVRQAGRRRGPLFQPRGRRPDGGCVPGAAGRPFAGLETRGRPGRHATIAVRRAGRVHRRSARVRPGPTATRVRRLRGRRGGLADRRGLCRDRQSAPSPFGRRGGRLDAARTGCRVAPGA